MHSILVALAMLSTAAQVAPAPATAPPVPPLPAYASPAAPAPPPLPAYAPPAAPGTPALQVYALQVHALQNYAPGLSSLGKLRDIADRYSSRPRPRPSWAPQDPADSLWRAARAALDEGEPRRAAELYRRLRTERRFQNSEYRPHAFYWEAFARHRIGGEAELRSALSALRALRSSYAQFENRVEVDRLESRLYADLAGTGDADAARWLREQTERAAGRQSSASAQCADQEVRVSVVESLLTMSSEQAMPLLKQVMSQKDACNAELREKAVFILSQKASGEAEDLLLDAAAGAVELAVVLHVHDGGFVLDEERLLRPGLDARPVGVAAWRLGAGRGRKEDPVSAAAGVVMRAKPGDTVRAGAPLLELHTDDPSRLAGALAVLDGAFEIGATAPSPSPLILDRIRS